MAEDNKIHRKTKEGKGFKHLVRIGDTDLDGSKYIIEALRKIKGINMSFSNALCKITDIDSNKKAGELSDEEIKKIDDAVKNPIKYNLPRWLYNRRKDYKTGSDMHIIKGKLDFVKDEDIQRMKKIKSYKGLRHQWGLTVRGQRTRSNFRKSKAKGSGFKRKK
ncbi:30S ribosomal protein S13 [Candidatus Woesearchaeota archaeon]|nr:30S ribosomal protein S13 [Candidatus Woesearchaeota archaeon]